MKNKQTRREFGATALATIAASVMPAPYVWAAEKKYDSGASDTEIKLGQTVPHSGPGSLYGVVGRVGEAYFQMLVSNLDYSDYLGRLAFGRIVSGRVKVGDSIVCIHKDGRRERGSVAALFGHQGLDRIEVKHAGAGDIIGLAGFEEISIGETLTPPLLANDLVSR